MRPVAWVLGDGCQGLEPLMDELPSDLLGGCWGLRCAPGTWGLALRAGPLGGCWGRLGCWERSGYRGKEGAGGHMSHGFAPWGLLALACDSSLHVCWKS